MSWRGGMLPQVVLWVDGDTDMSMKVTVKTISGSAGVVVRCVLSRHRGLAQHPSTRSNCVDVHLTQ